MANNKDIKKEELQKFEEKNRTQREALAAKQSVKKLEGKEEAAKADAWAKKQVAESQKGTEKTIQQQKDYKKRQKKERAEYEKFREKKDAELKELTETNAKREKERAAQLQYLKEMSIRNRWQILHDKKEDNAEMIKKKTKLSAEQEEKRKKQDAISEEKKEKKNVEKTTQKERGLADIFEKERTTQIRNTARDQQQKLKVKEQTEDDVLEGKIRREMAKAESYPLPAQKQMEKRKVSDMEQRERKKLRMKYIKLEQDIEVVATKDIYIIKKEAEKMRNTASMDERKAKLQLEETTRQKSRRAEKDTIQKKKDADDTELQMLADLPVMPTGDEDE